MGGRIYYFRIRTFTLVYSVRGKKKWMEFKVCFWKSRPN